MNWKIFSKLHTAIYRWSGGKLGARTGAIEVVLIDTIGRKSGKKRTVPIACYPYKDSVAVSASNSGQESHPAWYLNMQANPRVTAQLGQERFEAVAIDVPEEDREELWQRVTEVNPHQTDYLAQTSRKIPLVWLKRVEQ